MDLVVPVFNAAENLPAFLKSHQEVNRIIVVDGGSDDDSVKIAKDHGATVLSAGLGRGGQIAAGIAESTADLIAIAHVDTRPSDSWVPRLIKAAELTPQSPAFSLGQRFSNGGPALLFVEALNEARAIFGGSVFGDQTLIIRREALAQIGGFPDQPLMEDVEISWRLLELGRITYLADEWEVSAKKWDGRFLARFRQVVGLMIRYRGKRMKSREKAAEFSKALYREYYR